MRRINWTKPGRAHVIRNEEGLYITLIAFGWRLHLHFGRAGLGRGLWGD